MLNQTKSNLLTNQSDKGSILNYTSLKFICEICSYSATSIDSLRTHLNTHNDNKESGPTKLRSIVTPRQIVSKTLNQSMPSTIINMPQSMTVFNLKEISTKVFSKLKNFQPASVSILNNQSQPESNIFATANTNQNDTNKTSASVKASTASLIYNSALQTDNNQRINAESDSDKMATENSTKLDLNNNSLTQENRSKAQISAKQPISDQEETHDANETLAPALDTSISSPIKKKSTLNKSMNSLPYHYSECDKLYICNLCNCTYDSLRSIKAHLWKHSGHRELSYPIHDYKDKENSNNCIKSSPTDTRINKELPSNPTQGVSRSESCQETTPKDTLDLNSNSFCSSPKPCSSPVSPGSSSMQARQANSNNNNNSGGICSALLEVIEKLHDEEESLIEEPTSQAESDVQKENSLKQKKSLKRTAESKSTSGSSKECKIETSVVNSLLLDTDEFEENSVNNEMTKDKSHLTASKQTENKESSLQRSKGNSRGKQRAKRSLNSSKKHPLSKASDKTCKPRGDNATRVNMTVQLDQQTPARDSKDNQTGMEITSNQLNTSQKNDILSLLSSLANNDGFEQYVCGLCSYVCYHLPSLKSHMWTHVKSSKFDYSVNTSIINAALDYENKLNRKLNSIRNNSMFIENSSSDKTDTSETNDTPTSTDSKDVFAERQFVSALDLINYPLTAQKLSNICISMSMVSFRCSRCGFETIDLSLLRLHKREHNSEPALIE